MAEIPTSPGLEQADPEPDAGAAAGRQGPGAGGDEVLPDPEPLGLGLDLGRGRGHPQLDAVGDPAPAQHVGRLHQVVEAGVDAREEIGLVDLHPLAGEVGR